jgi:hypothetical protein
MSHGLAALIICVTFVGADPVLLHYFAFDHVAEFGGEIMLAKDAKDAEADLISTIQIR